MPDASFWKGRRVFLTGNTGFKGSWMSIWLAEMGAIIQGFSLPPPTAPSLFALAGLDHTMDWIEGDIRDRRAVMKAIDSFRPEIVFHFAAQPLVRLSYLDPVGTLETNIMGTVHVLESCRFVPGIRAIVNITSDKCYENREWIWGYRENEAMGGADPYSVSKGCAELITSAYRRSFFSSPQVQLASVRAGNVIGGGDFALDRLVPDIVRATNDGGKVVLRSPYSVRPWQHVLEPLSGYLLLAEKMYDGGDKYAEGWNFGPNPQDIQPVHVVAEHLTRLLGRPGAVELGTSDGPHEARLLMLDISKARGELGWVPRWSLTKALEMVASWDRENAYTSTVEQISLFEDSNPMQV